MKALLVLVVCASIATAQYGGPPPPPGAWGGGNRPSAYPKQPQPPSRPSPFGTLGSSISGSSGSSSNVPPSYDDPIPQIPHDSSYDSQTLPAKLPILAPNGVVEIYNRVVDDLIKRLEVDFSKKKMDPMPVVIRVTPAGPVRVPGYLQRRPFRRPGAALYRAGGPVPPSVDGPLLKKKKTGRSTTGTESRFPEGGRPAVGANDDKSTSRGSGKISKTPISNEDFVAETTPAAGISEIVEEQKVNSTEHITSSEEGTAFIRSRSDEYFPADDDEDDNKSSVVFIEKTKKTKKDDTAEQDDDDEDEKQANKQVDSLLARYESKTAKKPAKGSSKAKPAKVEKVSRPPMHSMEEDDDDDDEPDLHDDVDDDVSFDAEPGTGGGGRPQGGYYPPGGPPAVPAKPNGMMTGLSKIRRASDVAVSVDARSAMITSRLLVGPINIYVNESVEPKERGIKATIPELEAEIILMERHGVVFLQRFTLDRAYGQDVEISIPKSKAGSKKKNTPKQGHPGQPGYDPSGSPAAQDRYHTKMAAHVSMEVVKILRSGNLRVNLMRTAQASMSKLKLPIQKPKTKKTKGKDRNKDGGKSSEKH